MKSPQKTLMAFSGKQEVSHKAGLGSQPNQNNNNNNKKKAPNTLPYTIQKSSALRFYFDSS